MGESGGWRGEEEVDFEGEGGRGCFGWWGRRKR